MLIIIIQLFENPKLLRGLKNLRKNQIPSNRNISFSFYQFINLTDFFSNMKRKCLLCPSLLIKIFHKQFSWMLKHNNSIWNKKFTLLVKFILLVNFFLSISIFFYFCKYFHFFCELVNFISKTQPTHIFLFKKNSPFQWISEF